MIALLLAVAAPQAIGIHQRWGAFRDEAPKRCYAISRPVRGRGGASFASVGNWPGAGARGQVHVRLSRVRSDRARVVLAIGERRFELKAGRVDAWSPDTATDRAIVAAMRGGRSMSIESVAENGAPFVDVYALAGAATAIDAARLGCL
ncbi:hypothetical protein ASE90_06680 [Sphingomonas sp. Leaf67]|uniref:hypothetical protein n=1 Tax=Sphingomonas sp. Leaf67 TaxID=1736230 RepID=UPI0007023ACF|nr:hypothetical protein [Sphingomonas sp. Leaf67]KQN86959.1 hypothetical protein ASE90_06680 [Sphingomonas sp. Leaf67]